MRVITSFISVFFTFPFLLLIPLSTPQVLHDSSSSNNVATISPRTLDAILQDCAFKALIRPKTGTPYDAQVPKNLSGVSVSALRLRSGSLRNRGFKSYKEFQIPIGVLEQPYVKRLVLVYHNLGNLSENFYPLPGYSYLAPVLGLLAYSGANLTGQDLPELNLVTSDNSILINFKDVKKFPIGLVPKCVFFDLHGSVQFDILLPGNVCFTTEQGHFSIVVESSKIAPSPEPAAVAANFGDEHNHHHGGNKDMSKVWIIVASVFGGCIVFIILSLLTVRVKRAKRSMRIQQLEFAAESDETLHMASIGGTKAPLAVGTRTRPMIENDYIP
ncbi:hypothetical protein HN51_061169 [Arachis hypogaea]|uniref:Uncharacterized protein n=1 Tax=Arachis hypogaea TaxID=3818 RepID=A0A445AM97_ARAHY|nr:uncharacterized protein LOC107636752 [Arachis ipaensis]XP_025626355.1 uncharacterized protein LOC112719852 [Arachis hypogaea]QHO18361.1 uncharacterized protein DS421_11g319850 [Arachis hypogaea]RYR27548.1 hypothetical protein Ahy_B01g051565 [Arachis hypogaea]